MTLAELEAAAALVHATVAPTAQKCWPALCERLGTELWLKHENETPVGAFKLRGGLVYFSELVQNGRKPAGVISATRGNHGQSVAFAARRYGLPATIVVPRGNSRQKNTAMRMLGANLVEHGEDFQAAREHAIALAQERSLHMVPSFHPALVRGVASYSLELLRAVADIDVVYVPIGLGSGICGAMAARDALGLRTTIVGVVAEGAPAYALSFAARKPVEHAVTTVLADGMACRVPEPEALRLIQRGVDRIVQVGEDEIADAMRAIHEATNTVTEGAGAAAFAAAVQEQGRLRGKRVAAIVSGGNVDKDVFEKVLAS